LRQQARQVASPLTEPPADLGGNDLLLDRTISDAPAPLLQSISSGDFGRHLSSAEREALDAAHEQCRSITVR